MARRSYSEAFARPLPPADLLEPLAEPAFIPAPDVERWLRQTFIEAGGPLHNPEHQHLEQATLGVLWTNVANVKQGNIVAATCENPKPTQGSKWLKARLVYQLCEWFGDVPDFLLTFHAGICGTAPDVAFCSTVDHELYHAGQARDEYGMPRFRKDDGRPIFTMRGHDVEEFVGIVRRYGAHGVLNPQVRELVEVAQDVPIVAQGAVRLACGVCLAV